jgi:hypothetical protein
VVSQKEGTVMIIGKASSKMYVEQVKGSYKHSSYVVPLEHARSIDEDLYGMPLVEDAYQSVFSLDSSINDLVKESGSIRGYDGVVYTDYIHWDFDSDVDLSSALRDAVELLDRLVEIGIDIDMSCRICYSGRKGAHIFLLSEDIKKISGQNDTNAIVKHVAENLATGLSSFDTSVYDKTRIIRVTNSLHGKSHLYKIPLSYSEIRSLSSSDIMQMAEKQREFEQCDELSSCEYIQQLIEEYGKGNEDKKRKPSVAKGTVLSGILEGFGGGERNRGLTSLAGMLHSKDISEDIIRGLVMAINDKGSDPLPLEDIDTIVRSVSRYKINEQYIETSSSDIVTVEEAYRKWKGLKLKLKQAGESISTGYPTIDKALATFDPGKVMLIAAKQGVGKTLLGMHLGNSIAKSTGGTCLFSSLEMPSTAVFYSMMYV